MLKLELASGGRGTGVKMAGAPVDKSRDTQVDLSKIRKDLSAEEQV